MVKEKYTSADIRKIVRALVERLEMHSIPVDKIILYGSYAKGRPRPHSDVDIAVISSAFTGRKMLDIQGSLARILSGYLSVVEPIGYSIGDYLSAGPETLLGEIKRSGKILFNRDEMTGAGLLQSQG